MNEKEKVKLNLNLNTLEIEQEQAERRLRGYIRNIRDALDILESNLDDGKELSSTGYLHASGAYLELEAGKFVAYRASIRRFRSYLEKEGEDNE